MRNYTASLWIEKSNMVGSSRKEKYFKEPSPSFPIQALSVSHSVLSVGIYPLRVR
jgi:hypothetical protein